MSLKLESIINAENSVAKGAEVRERAGDFRGAKYTKPALAKAREIGYENANKARKAAGQESARSPSDLSDKEAIAGLEEKITADQVYARDTFYENWPQIRDYELTDAHYEIFAQQEIIQKRGGKPFGELLSASVAYKTVRAFDNKVKKAKPSDTKAGAEILGSIEDKEERAKIVEESVKRIGDARMKEYTSRGYKGDPQLRERAAVAARVALAENGVTPYAIGLAIEGRAEAAQKRLGEVEGKYGTVRNYIERIVNDMVYDPSPKVSEQARGLTLGVHKAVSEQAKKAA